MPGEQASFGFGGRHVLFTRWTSDVRGECVAATVKCDGCQWRLHTGTYSGDVSRDGAEALARVCCELNGPGVIR